MNEKICLECLINGEDYVEHEAGSFFQKKDTIVVQCEHTGNCKEYKMFGFIARQYMKTWEKRNDLPDNICLITAANMANKEEREKIINDAKHEYLREEK